MRPCDQSNFASARLLFAVYALFIQCIACSHPSHIIALQCIAYLFAVRDRSLGIDAPESSVEAIEEVLEDTIEPDHQQAEGKQLSILTLKNLFW